MLCCGSGRGRAARARGQSGAGDDDRCTRRCTGGDDSVPATPAGAGTLPPGTPPPGRGPEERAPRVKIS